MPKRKSLTGRAQRNKDSERKRQKRQAESCPHPPPDETLSESSASQAVMDVAAPGSECGSIGLPPSTLKPLTRVQASPCEKMHLAPRLSSPRGSRLIAPKSKVASPDSPVWVCAPARVPESDIWMMSDSAGQAQLIPPKGEMVSKALKKDGRHIEEHKEIIIEEIKENTEESMKSEIYDRNSKEMLAKKYEACKEKVENTIRKKFEVENSEDACLNKDIVNIDRKTEEGISRTSDGRSSVKMNLSVQGSFHQGDIMFGENAGTQCVANSLTALAYHKVKDSKQWQSADMNKILATGDEMYSYLQQSSTIGNRYLLVSELPQFFECFGQMYEFKANESLPSLINLADVVLNYADFNAYELLEALQIALDETDGCFVCFGGNTFLVGKCHHNFFTFDSHSRSSAGFQSVNGRSTRVLYESIQDVCSHILSLAVSMGYSLALECEITGVQCSVKKISLGKEEGIPNEMYISDEDHELNNSANNQCNISQMNSIGLTNTDEVEFVGSEKHQIRFLPLSNDQKKKQCEILGIPFLMNDCENRHQYGQEITVPMNCVQIEPDGNCFFRAISFCLTGKQDYHHTIRLAICNHLLENALLFRPFLRQGQNSTESHISLSGMLIDGKWATEIEILALSHLLKTEIYTFSQNRWVTFSGQMVNSEENMAPLGGIYLDNKNQNHYDVVTSVHFGENISMNPVQKLLCWKGNRRKFRDRNKKRQHQESDSISF